MSTGPACRTSTNTFPIAGILILASAFACADDEDEPGWITHIRPAKPWTEVQGELPDYPKKADLLEIDISTGGQPYTLYLDAPSVHIGEDTVVRYTVVMISVDDVWNISHEGLHCGERRYRRYAYGHEGRWHEIGFTPWKPLSGHGVNQYRKAFYDDYMCNQSSTYNDARQIIERIRSSAYGHDE